MDDLNNCSQILSTTQIVTESAISERLEKLVTNYIHNNPSTLTTRQLLHRYQNTAWQKRVTLTTSFFLNLSSHRLFSTPTKTEGQRELSSLWDAIQCTVHSGKLGKYKIA